MAGRALCAEARRALDQVSDDAAVQLDGATTPPAAWQRGNHCLP